MTTDLDALLTAVDGERMAGMVAALDLPAARRGALVVAGMGGYHSPADTPDRVDTATLAAVCRLVVATVWLATRTQPATLGPFPTGVSL